MEMTNEHWYSVLLTADNVPGIPPIQHGGLTVARVIINGALRIATFPNQGESHGIIIRPD